MTSVLDANGLTIETLPEIVTDLTTQLQAIYPFANVASNSPDGQMINIFAQADFDQLQLLAQVNAGFDPDQAIGVILDQRAAINNIQRQGGTFTIIAITIVTTATVTLAGLDGNFNNVNGTGFTIQDNAGNQYILIDTTTLTAGTNVLDFRAQMLGPVTPVVNTITNIVTVTLGVSSVNNPSGALSIGQNQETDSQLRIRRQQSVALASNGYLNGLLGAILNLPGVVGAALYENVSNVTDGNGIPAHGIWLIVDGGANTDIADQIYGKISYGANMKGSVSVPITTASGGTFNALFDRPASVPLYIKFNIQKTISTATFNQAAIKSYIAANQEYTIGQYADQASLTVIALAAINATGGGGVPNEVMISTDNVTYVDYLATPTLGSEFTLSTANMFITVL